MKLFPVHFLASTRRVIFTRHRVIDLELSSDLKYFHKDTETLYTVATQNILNEYSPGKIYTWDVKVGLMGLQREPVSRKIVEIYDLPLTWEEYADLAAAQTDVLMKNCHLMPGMYGTQARLY